jgi:hypothetical protein
MNRFTIFCSAIGAAALLNTGLASMDLPTPVGIQTAEAQQMGRSPWKAQTRNRSMAAQYQYLDRTREANNGGGGGAGSIEQYTYNHTYNSSSNSVGNLNEITQILSGGSTGTISQEADQASNGNQGSAANTQAAIDSTTTSSSSASSNASPSAGDINSTTTWFGDASQ